MVQPIWLKMVRWELPSVMGGLGLIGTMAGKAPKLKLGRARFKARWGWAARGLNDEAMDALKWIEVNSPWLIVRAWL